MDIDALIAALGGRYDADLGTNLAVSSYLAESSYRMSHHSVCDPTLNTATRQPLVGESAEMLGRAAIWKSAASWAVCSSVRPVMSR